MQSMRKRWTNHEINDALRRLGACYELPTDRAAALEARVRREVIARYGRFDVPLQSAVHASGSAPRGILVVLRPMLRPIPVFAGMAAVVIGAFLAMREARAPGALPAGGPAADSSTVIAEVPPAPITQGSGVGLSVFSVAVTESAPTASPAAPTGSQVRPLPQRPRRVNPVPGVFSRWGTSVFSEDEMLKAQRDGKSVFHS